MTAGPASPAETTRAEAPVAAGADPGKQYRKMLETVPENDRAPSSG